jgi:6-phosphofructokinase
MKMQPGPRIGVLTGGGDCPGLNAVIRAVAAVVQGVWQGTVLGIEDGFDGLLHGRIRELAGSQLDGLISQGGTILGTTNKGDPWLIRGAGDAVAAQMLEHIRAAGLQALIVVGGDGSMTIAQRLSALGVPIVGVPKTIDNDLQATDVTFGFDTAVTVIVEALDRLATTAAAHHRVMVLEVMGRDAGWLALAGGVAGGADVIGLPEWPFEWAPVCDHVRRRVVQKPGYALMCIAEGLVLPPPPAGSASGARNAGRRVPSGPGEMVAQVIEQQTGIESRCVVLGHLQRGGAPSAADRLLATRLGVAAAECACRGEHSVMVALRGTEIVPVPLVQVATGARKVPVDHDWIRVARALGVHLGSP